MQHVIAGLLNKQIAAELNITEDTVKFHRGHIMRKMRADSLADLVRMAENLGSVALASRSQIVKSLMSVRGSESSPTFPEAHRARSVAEWWACNFAPRSGCRSPIHHQGVVDSLLLHACYQDRKT